MFDVFTPLFLTPDNAASVAMNRVDKLSAFSISSALMSDVVLSVIQACKYLAQCMHSGP